MIEESDSEYKEDSYDASDDENYIPAANGGTGTPEDSDIEQEMIIEQEEECDSDESVEDEPVPQNVSRIWIAKDKAERSSNPLPSAQTRSRYILRQRSGPAGNSDLFTPDELMIVMLNLYFWLTRATFKTKKTHYQTRKRKTATKPYTSKHAQFPASLITRKKQ